MSRRLAILLLAATLALPLAAQEVISEEGIVVRELARLPEGHSHGYYEIAFQVTNSVGDATHHVAIEIPNRQHHGGNNAIRRLRNEVIVGPGSSAKLTLHKPSLPLAGSDVRIFVDGRLLRERISLYVSHPNTELNYSSSGTLKARRVLVSQTLQLNAFPENEAVDLLRAETSVAAWSDSWLAFSGYDGIVITLSDLETATAGVRSSLARYVETGGSLAVIGAGELPSWLEITPHGRAHQGGLDIVYRGFGTWLFHPGGLPEFEQRTLDRLDEAWLRSRNTWDLLRNPSRVHHLFPAIEDLQIPVRGLFLMILAFTILIGPVNLAILTRRRQRIHLLWTVPAIALVASFAIFAYAWIGEGMIRTRASVGITLLDQAERRAVTLGWLGFYSTLTPGDGLHFDRETEVSAVLDWQQQGNGNAPSLLWGESQHFASGWLTARLPAYFILRKSELRHERLRFRPLAGGGFEVLNSLGADVKVLHMADSDGQVYTATEVIPAGAAGRLTRSGEKAEGGPETLRLFYTSELPLRVKVIQTQPTSFLRPSTYIAELASNPFLEAGLADAEQRQLVAVVYGILLSEAGE